MWTVFMTPAEFALLIQGKTIEKLLTEGLISFEPMPEPGPWPAVKITYLTEEEAGQRLTRGRG